MTNGFSDNGKTNLNGQVSLTPDEGGKTTAKELLYKYLVYLPLFIVVMLLSFAIAWLYIRYTNPSYTSTISMLFKDDKYNRGGGEEMLLEDLVQYRKKANLANETEVLLSVNLMKNVVDELNLNVSYYSEGNVKTSEMYGDVPIRAVFKMVNDSSKSKTITLKLTDGKVQAAYGNKEFFVRSGSRLINKDFVADLHFDLLKLAPGYTYTIHWQSPTAAAAALTKSISINQLSREASILVLRITTEVPAKGRAILNALANQYNQRNIEDKNRIVDNTLRFIDDRLDILTSELGKVEKGIETFRQDNRIYNLDKQSELTVNELNTLKAQLEQQEIKLAVINMVSEYVANPARRFQLVPSSLGIEDVTLLALVQEYNSLQLKRELQLKSVKPQHPAVVALETQLEKVRTSLVENLYNIKRAATGLNNRLKANYSSLQSQLGTIPKKERQSIEISRQQGIKEKLYIFLLQKREDAAITRASAIAGSVPLDPAYTSPVPVKPNRTNIYRFAFVLGLLIPALIIYLRDLLNDKVVTRSDITRSVQAPLVGEIAHHRSKNRTLVIGVKDRSLLAEQFRTLRTNLQFVLPVDKKSHTLMITSSTSGEGKTFTSLNIGAAYALAGKKTVILELDLRKPKLSEALMLTGNKGITHFLLKTASVQEVTIPVEQVPGLYVVPSGVIPPNPSELLMNPRMDELMADLQSKFDLIILDTAPVGLVSDAKILSAYADATLYVVRQRYTFKKQMQLIADLQRTQTLPNICILVNDVKVGGANAYYGHGYSFGYGSGYDYENYHTQKSRIKKLKEFLGV